MLKTKVAAVTVIGPLRSGSKFPDDLQLHIFGRRLVEENNPELEFEWFVAFRKSWGHEYPESRNSHIYALDSASVPELSANHPSVDHGAMLNHVLRTLPDDLRFVLILDPDCFLLGPNALQEHIGSMSEKGVAVSGTPYGLTFPKSFFRDFPTVFAMIIDRTLVQIKDLDFMPDLLELEMSLQMQNQKNRHSPKSASSRLRQFLRNIVSPLIKWIFGVANPILWWGFLMACRLEPYDGHQANDTSSQVRKHFLNSIKHQELQVVVSRGSLSRKSSPKIVAQRRGSNQQFGSAEYFRNHGVFEGWTLKRGGLRELLVEKLALVLSGGRPLENNRFPTSSLVFSEELSNVVVLDRFLASYPGVDSWAYQGSVFAIHLGLPTKLSLSGSESWDQLRTQILELSARP
jgi:hypothetical protein